MNPFGKLFILAWLALGALLAATAQTEPAVRFEVTLYGTGLPGAGAPLSSLTDVKAGDSFDVKLRVLDQAGNLVPTYSKNVLLTIRAEFGQDTTVNVTGSDILAGGGETTLPITVTPSHAMTARTETDPNGWLYETGARISATDGSVITDNASGFFSVNPARFAVTYSGSSNPLVSTLFTAGRSYFARVTAYNADGTVASGYRGTVQVGFTHTKTTTDEYIINGVTLLDRGAGYDSDNPPLVTIVGDGDGATARASVIDLNGTNVIGAIGLGSAGSGYTVQPTITVEAPPDDGDPDTVEATAVAVIRGYEIVRPVANLGLDNATSLITDGGSGYDEFTPPAVTVVGGGGSGAVATATVSSSGAVTGITLDFSAATGYTSVPTLTIDPPADPAGTQATAEIVPVVAIEDTAGTASIVFGGIADLVPIIMPVAGNGYQLAADDGITFTADASEVFATRQTGNGSVLTVSDVTIRSGGDDAGESTSLTYTLKNDTDEPDINVSGPIDVHFVLYEGDRQRLQWTERVNASLFSAPDNESIERLGTSFTIPENLIAGSYTLEVWPGYNRNNAGTVGITLGNPPDLAITQFDYAPGQYRGGDAIRFDLTYHNQFTVGLTTALTTAFPHDGEYMIQIHLSTNSVYGDADDFLVWQESVRGTRAGTRLLPGQQMETSRYFKLPENMAGTYYVYARVNSAGGRDGTGLTPEFTSGVTIAGNNTIPPMESQKITILPKQASDTFRVSLTNAGSEAGGLSDNAAITRDGQYVVFESFASLAGATAADINNIFLRNLDGSSTTLISVASGAAAANGHSANPEISADGRYVVFQSSASNLVAGDSNGLQDIFVRDTQLDITRRLSVNPVTGKQANAGSQLPSISADGRYVVFESSATNLSTVTAPSGVTQIYLYDRDADGDGIYDELDSGARTLTVVTQVSNTAGASSSTQPRISADGNYVAFITRCSTFLGLVTDSPYTQIVRWSRVSDQFKPVTISLSSAGDLGDYNSAFPAINADGSYIAFASLAQNLEAVPGVYIWNIPHVFRASIDASGSVSEIKRMNSQSGSILDEPDNPLDSSIFAPDLGSYEPSISDDGQLVAFASESQNLLAPVTVKSVDRTTFTSLYVYNSTDTNYSADVYLYNLDPALPAPTVERASVSRFGYEASIYTEAPFTSNLNRPVSRRPVISGNGRYVAYSSSAEGRSGLIFGATNYVNADNNGVRDIYVYDRKAALPNYQNIPVVSLLPLGLAKVNAGQPVTLVADAASAIRGIASVEFYANNSLIGSVAIPASTSVNRFALTWTAPSPGVGNTQTRPYQINVLAVDTAGVRSELSNEATLYVQQQIGTPASVVIQNPVSPSTSDVGSTASVTVPQGNALYLVAGVTVGSSPVNPVNSVAFYAVSNAEGTRLLGTSLPLGGNRFGLSYGNSLPVGDHTLIAVVTDDAGNIVQSAGRLLHVTAAVTGTAPTGSLVFPAAGSEQTLGQEVAMQALASDVDGAVASVAFYANGTLVGTDLTAPFTAAWTPTVAGAYNLVLVITDAQGATTVTAPVAVTVKQSSKPSVSLVSPAAATRLTVGSSLALEATASDADGTIASVGFYADGALVATGARVGNSTTYTATWSPALARSGAYKLTVKATDNVGQVTETAAVDVTVDAASGSAPVVQVTNPAAGGQNQAGASAALGSQVYLSANASDNLLVTGVNFYADGVSIGAATRQGTTNQWVLNATLSGAPFSSKGVGSYAITAIASDADRNQTQSAVVTLNVTAAVTGTAPTVEAVFPSSGQTLTLGGALTLQAVATDTEGAIASVAVYANGVLVGTTTSAPYAITWTPSLAGSYNIVYVVTDSQGATTVTTPTTVVVRSVTGNAPVANLLFPVAGNNSYTNASTIPLAVNVVDSDQPAATAPSIVFYVDGSAIPAVPVRLGNSQSYYVEFSTSQLTTGIHTALAVVNDAAGNTSSSVTTFTVTQATGPSFNTKPSLTANGAAAITITAGDTFAYQLEASRTNGRLVKMDVFLNGVSRPDTAGANNLSQNPVTQAPFISTWYAGQYNGKTGAYALATDDEGNVMLSNLVEITRLENGEPTIAVISPVGATTLTFGQPIVMDIEAKATTAGDIIKSIQFLANSTDLSDTLVTRLPGTDIWRLSFLPSVHSTYAVNAIATTRGTSTVDPANGQPFERSKTSATRTFTVLPVVGIAPSITLTQPTSSSAGTGGTTTVVPATATSGSPILLIAQATAGGSSIAQVEFFARSGLGGTASLGMGTQYGTNNLYSKTAAPLAVGNYELFAVVTDSKGNMVQSNLTSLTVTASVTTAPGVTLAAPVPSTVVQGRSTLLTASATPASGATISSVAFYVNGVLVNTDTAAPYSFSYTAPAVGSYKVVAVATDSAGNINVSAENDLTVTANAGPVVSISAPVLTVELGTPLAISATATDADGMDRVVFTEYLGTAINDAIKTTEDRLSPYGYQFNPTQTGQYIIRAEAFDDLGFSDTASLVVNVVRNTAKPTIEFIAPAVGATAVVGQATPVEVKVTVPTGATVNSIAFFANGVKIGDGFKQGTLDVYRLLVEQNNTQLPWSPSVTGSLALTAEIVDSFGGRAETAAARQLLVVGQVGALPFVEIIQPVPPATTGGGTPASLSATTNSDLNLAASAVDSDGTVENVEFFLDLGRAAKPTATVTFPSVVVNGAALQQSTGYISSITFTDGGIGYLSPPEVKIIGDGEGATAEAEILNGAISRIRITNRGSGYTNAIVRLVGGGLVENLSIGAAQRDFFSDVWRLATPFNFKSYGAGFYTFRAVAKDNNNNVQSSSAVSVTVSPAPLTTPVTGNVVSTPSTADVDGQRVPAGQTVQLALTPSVVGGTVASVEFFANGESVGSDTAAPFIVNWVPSFVGSYNVFAVVTDSVGNQGVSSAKPVYVGGNIAPTIILIRPAAGGATGVVNQIVLLEAEASALTSGATVSTVEFNADGESVGIASQVGTSNRYVLSTWRPASAKTYSITARVVDSFGQAVLSPARTLTVQTQTGVIPTVSLTSPASTGTGGTTGGGLSVSNNSALFLSAQANDADGSVYSVEFLMSRGQQATAVATLLNGVVNTITVGAGSGGGAGGGGSGYLYAPQVKIVGNGVGAVAEAVVANGVVTSIRLVSGGSGYTSTPQVVFEGGGLYENLVINPPAVNAPGTLTWSTSLDLRNFDVGPYFFSARVTDNQGNTSISSSSAVTVTQATASAPVVTLSAPTPASIDLGLTSNLVAIATPAVGVSITKVDFYANGTLVSTAPLAPYLLAFTAPSAGSYEIYAMATDSAGNATLSQARTLVVQALAADATLANIDRAYQALLDRSSTSAETKSALARNGVNLTSGQVAELILQSSDYRDNQAKLILSHFAVWGTYPNNSDYADLQAKKLALTLSTDAGLIDAILASPSYKQRYGDIADLSTVNPTQYNRVRDFAVRIYTNLYGKAPAKAVTTNTVAKQFFTTISTGGSAGQAVVNFINANFGTVSRTPVIIGDTTGGAVTLATNLQPNATLLARLRVAGAILLIGNEQPTAAKISALSGMPLAAVADYYFEGDTPFAAGTMVSIETATESVAGTTYYASGLPKGLTMNRATGVISGRLPSSVKGYTITYWSQIRGVRSASTTRILMVEALEAKFIGANEALLLDEDGLPAGKLTVKVASTADYSGTLVYRDGATYSFKGVLSVVFDDDGVSTAFGEQPPIKRKAPLTTLDVGLGFDVDGALSVTVTEGDEVAPAAFGDAIRVFNFTKAAPAPWQGSYKVDLLDVTDVPYFDTDIAGSGTLSVANTGVLSVALVGKDGVKITGKVSGSLDSDYRLYIRPYSKKPVGYFAGAIRFSDEATPSEVDFPIIGNDLTWFRPAGLAPVTDGFGPLKIQLDYAPAVP